jgi:ABC-type phosphate transport system permease subunit
MACVFPFAGICLVAAFWGFLYYFSKTPKVISKLTMSIIILIFMTLPTVTSITFAIYNCVDVFNDGNTYLALDVSM